MFENEQLTDNLAAKLADAGLRATAQREVIYHSLVTRRDHPTAEDVFARVKADMPTISLATVYNCLETLVQCNLIRQFNHERGPTRYCPNLEPHAHFFDEQSGTTVDVALPPKLLSELKAILPPGMSASAIEITFRGKSS